MPRLSEVTGGKALKLSEVQGSDAATAAPPPSPEKPGHDIRYDLGGDFLHPLQGAGHAVMEDVRRHDRLTGQQKQALAKGDVVGYAAGAGRDFLNAGKFAFDATLGMGSGLFSGVVGALGAEPVHRYTKEAGAEYATPDAEAKTRAAWTRAGIGKKEQDRMWKDMSGTLREGFDPQDLLMFLPGPMGKGKALKAAETGVEALTPAKIKAAKRMMGPGKLDPEKMRTQAAEHRAVGAGEPTMAELASTPTQRVGRSAGIKSPEAAERLEDFRDRSRESLSGRGVSRAKELRPHPNQEVSERVEALEKEKNDRADSQWRRPYAEPIKMDEKLFDALNIPEMMGVIDHAMKGVRLSSLDSAEAARIEGELSSIKQYRRDRVTYERAHGEWEAGPRGEYTSPPDKNVQTILENPRIPETAKQQIREAHGWKETPEPQPPEFPTVSGGALDHIRRATASRKQAAYGKDADKYIGSGYGVRESALDEYLDGVPHLKEARADYHDYSERIRQVEFKGRIASTNPGEFKRQLEKLTPEQLRERRQAVAIQLENDLGGGSRQSQTSMDRLITGEYGEANLRALFGDEAAAAYVRAQKLMSQRVKNATFMSSRIGSKGEADAADRAIAAGKIALHAASHGHYGAFKAALDFLGRTGFKNLKPEEAEHIAEWITSQNKVEDTLAEIEKAAKGKSNTLPVDIKQMIAGAAAVHAAQPAPPESDDQP